MITCNQAGMDSSIPVNSGTFQYVYGLVMYAGMDTLLIPLHYVWVTMDGWVDNENKNIFD